MGNIRGWTATIFAKNEAADIDRCIRSVRDQGAELIFVMVNGSTDATAARARNHAVTVVEIDMPCKSNAWNVAVHDHLPRADVHFFVDGYATVMPGSFSAMAQALAENPRANACAAIPGSGRSRVMLAAEARRGHIHGSLHALAGHFVQRIKAQAIYLPVGLYRGDGLIGSMALHDLDNTTEWDRSLVVCAPDASWTFRSLSPFRVADWQRWLARRKNQKRGVAENDRLKRIIYSQGFGRLPKTI